MGRKGRYREFSTAKLTVFNRLRPLALRLDDELHHLGAAVEQGDAVGARLRVALRDQQERLVEHPREADAGR